MGPMGAGKTTIGRMLARQLGMDFFDSDHEIEKRTGVNIPLIFEIEGEEGFRKREKTAISNLTAMSDIVMAAGGGAILKKANRKALSESGIVIYLKASPEKLFRRTRKDTMRPLLQTDDPQKRIIDLLNKRDPLYREIADFIIDTDGLSIKKIIREIVDHPLIQ